MNKYIKGLFLGALVFGFTSCEDFLDREPESSVTAENFFNTGSNLQAYTNSFYSLFPTHSNNMWALGTFSNDNGTDNQAAYDANDRFVTGRWTVPASSGNWSFGTLRQVNFFFNYVLPNIEAGILSTSDETVAQALGEAYFFRAFTNYNNYKEIGDYPIVTELLPDDKEVLLEATLRRPRNQVARFILDDLEKAIQYLPVTSSKGKNGLNKACAQLFRSRVALFEGTWLKHHKGTAFVPGGPGWPGDQSMLNGFNIDTEISYFFQEAMASAKPVADAIVNNLVENTGEYVAMYANLVSRNPYYTMFCDEDLNPYSEVLMFKSYNLELGVITSIQDQLQRNGAGTGYTRALVNSYVMRNGLPIYASGSGYDPEWENQGIEASLQNRDSRIQIFVKYDNCIEQYSSDGTPITFDLGNILLAGATNTKTTTGYTIKKGMSYDWEQTIGRTSTTGSIVFRATEAMLNYMEACVELNGSVDNTADGYWRALRTRALINPDYNTTVAATDMTQEASDWGAYSHGVLIDPLLYNVRRERRNELISESLRMDDLRRWAALDQMITTPYFIEGMKFWGTCYTDPSSPLYFTDQVILDPTNGNMSSQEWGPYIHPYQEKTVNNPAYDGYRFTRAHYLSPIGQNNFTDASADGTVSTTVLYQNPGWPMLAGETAQNVN